MPNRRARALGILSIILLPIGSTFAQTNSPVSFQGLVTSPLTNAPPAPTVRLGTCTGLLGNVTPTYAVTAVDFAGGTTPVGTASTALTGACTTFSAAVYTIVTTPVISGAASCNVYRITGGTAALSTGYIGNVTCGGPWFDIGTATTIATPSGSTNTTGGIFVAGAVAAQVLTAGGTGGTGAGTDVLGAGIALSTCANTAAPFYSCIPPMSAFFQQAPSGSINPTIGITWPSTLTSAATISAAAVGPFIFGNVSTGGGLPNTSPVIIGSMTDARSPVFASASGTLTAGHLVKLITGTSGIDFADAGIALSGGLIPTTSLTGTLGFSNGGTNTTVGPVSTLCAGSTINIGAGHNVYLGFGTANTTESAVDVAVPFSGTVVALHATASAAPSSAVTVHARYQNALFPSGDLTCNLSGTACDAIGGTQAIAESMTGTPTTWDIQLNSGSSTVTTNSYAVCLKVVGVN
jgi:hypothetical protein